VYGCFFDDAHGLRSIEEIGVENVTYESDYPHSDSTWPRTREIAEAQTKGLDDDVILKIMRGNAIKMLGLELPEYA
jgi:predicted TIM-barrel fold metal-dependent hydrolase